MSATAGGVTAQGHGTGEGGGPLGVSTKTGAPGQVCNQQLLVLDRNSLPAMTDLQARDLAIVEIEFARNVSMQAVAAYNRILAILGTPRD